MLEQKITEKTKINIDDRMLDDLHQEFLPLSIGERLKKLNAFFNQDDIMMTSSFGTKSIFLLHHIYRFLPEQKIYFLDTKYLFRETYIYKELLREKYNLRLTYIYPEKKQNELTTEERWWNDHPRMCCTANKIVPLEPYIAKHKLWISGLMHYQTQHRSRFRIFERNGDILKFHPIIDYGDKEIQKYIDNFDLPRHPMENRGYGSLGCTHCTLPGSGREGRWENTLQKECGIHLNYFYNDKKKNT